MKKIIIILLIACLSFGLIGCKKDNPNAGKIQIVIESENSEDEG